MFFKIKNFILAFPVILLVLFTANNEDEFKNEVSNMINGKDNANPFSYLAIYFFIFIFGFLTFKFLEVYK